MPIDTYSVSAAQARRLLAIEEGHFYDTKAIEIDPGKLTKTISAFANADGGELYIGIDEDKVGKTRSWRGFDKPESANGHVQVFEQLFPLGQYFSYSFLSSPNMSGFLLYVEIRKTPDIKFASNRVAYLRRGAQNLPVDTDEKLRRLKLDKGIVSFESETVAVDKAELIDSQNTLQFLSNIIPTAEPERWLKKQQLLINEKPTVGGVILFAEEPQAVLPKRCAIKVYRYKTQDTVGSRETLAGNPITVEGCAYNQIYAAVKKTKELIEGIQKLGPSGLEPVQYPDETLHEIITNAVLHRDYSIADDVHVRIFDNRVEVESPGLLPGHVTVKNILDERFARNGNLVRLINKFPNPPNKDVGEGLNTAFDAMAKLRLKTPEIKQRENSVVVYIRHEPLASPESIILEYLEGHASINNKKVRELCHIREDWAVRRVLRGLEDRGLIERIPGTRTAATAYRKKK